MEVVLVILDHCIRKHRSQSETYKSEVTYSYFNQKKLFTKEAFHDEDKLGDKQSHTADLLTPILFMYGTYQTSVCISRSSHIESFILQTLVPYGLAYLREIVLYFCIVYIRVPSKCRTPACILYFCLCTNNTNLYTSSVLEIFCD